MKNLLLIALTICIGLFSSIKVATASNFPGQSPCAFNTYLVKKAGFCCNRYYSSACICQLLSRLNVTPLCCTHIASGRYRYVCSEYHKLATNKLIPDCGQTIYWHTSQPF